MVYRNLRQDHLHEAYMMQIPADYVNGTTFGPSHVHGHGPWLVCEVTLSNKWYFITKVLKNILISSTKFDVIFPWNAHNMPFYFSSP